MWEGANIKISGTITDINGKSTRNILEYILSGKQIDSAEYDILYEKKVIVHNLKATKEQIIDNLNGVMSQLQRKMMKILLNHLDELNRQIKELYDDIDNFIKPEEKEAANAIQDISGTGNTSAQAVVAVTDTDMGRFSTDTHISSSIRSWELIIIISLIRTEDKCIFKEIKSTRMGGTCSYRIASCLSSKKQKKRYRGNLRFLATQKVLFQSK